MVRAGTRREDVWSGKEDWRNEVRVERYLLDRGRVGPVEGGSVSVMIHR